MKISILEKSRAPSRCLVRKGLEYELFSTGSLRPLRRRTPASTEQNPGAEYETEVVPATVVVNLVEVHIVREERDDEGDWRDHSMPQTEPEASDASVRGGDMRGGVGTGDTTRQEQSAQEYQAQQVRFLHRLFSFKVQFSVALLPQRLPVSCDSDNVANIAYMRLKVKCNRKSPYFRAFSGVLFWIKKFSFPRMQNCQFIFESKIQYELVADLPAGKAGRSEANQNSLTFPTWCPGWESNPHEVSLTRF